MKRSIEALAVVGAVLFCVAAHAAVPEVISFQGKLADAAGDPVTSAVSVEFNLYASDTGGASLWSETHASVTPTDGLFAVMLGSVTTFASASVDFTQPLWLGVTVGTDAEMTPRFELASAPYALRAGAADGVDWTGVANVPAGFADDVDDDTQLSGAQVTSYVTVSSIDLAAGTTLGGVALSTDGHAHSSLSGPGGSPADALVVDGAGNVTVSGELTVADRAYGMVYRTTPFDIAGWAWEDLPFDGGSAGLYNVSHDTATNAERVTLAVGGTYLVRYVVYCQNQTSPHHVAGRVVKNGTSELPGSTSIVVPGTFNSVVDNPLVGQVLASLTAGDYVSVQVAATSGVLNEVDVFGYPGAATPITASLIVQKIGP